MHRRKTNKMYLLRKYSLGHIFGFSALMIAGILSLLSSTSVSATAKQSTLSLTVSTNTISADIKPEANGAFGKSDDATISVTTDNFTGYMLSIAAADSTDLESTNGSIIPSITSAISENTFSSSSSYNNKWGYKPSQYVTTSGGTNTKVTNTDTFLPSPSTTGDILDITSGANSTANTYTIAIGARADLTLPPGAYSNTFIITVVSNEAPYSITYNKNTTDTVSNMPATNPQVAVIQGDTPTAESYATLSSNVPTRTGYTFNGWCDTQPTQAANGNQTCTGNTYAAGANFGIDQTIDETGVVLYATWEVNDYAITIHAGNGVSTLALSGWTGTGTATMTKTYHIGDTIDLSTITPTYKTAYSGTNYVKNDSIGTLSSSTYTVGAGAGDITIHATTLDTPVCTIKGGTTKVYNRSATTLTATSNATNYDTGSTNITYSFGYATNGTNTLGNFGTAGTSNTVSIAANAYRGTRYYGVKVTVTNKNDSTITNTCTSGTVDAAVTGETVANRTTLVLVNSRINFDATTNGGTLTGTTPLYVQYNGAETEYFTGRTNATAGTLPTANPPTGYTFAGWYTSADAKVINADGTLTGSAVSGWTNADKKWVKTGTATSATSTANTLYAHYDPKTYNITLDRNCTTTAAGSTSTTATYDATTLAAITVPTCSNTTGTRTVSGFTKTTSATNSTVSATTTLNSTNTTTYTFNGWYKESGATNKIASNATTPALQASTSYTDANSKWTNDGAVTLYAGWTASAGNYSSVTLPTITRTGSTCGWSTSSTATTITYASGASLTPSANTTLYGVCVNNITLNNAGATTAGSTSATVNYNATALSTITLPQRKYTVSGFTKTTSATNSTISSTSTLTNTATFNGWYTASSGGTKIAAGGTDTTPDLQASTTYTDANKKWTYTTAGAITLYSQWTDNAVTLPTITRTGSTCGWSTSSTATIWDTGYTSGASITPTSNLTLYGVCRNNITLNKNGATNSPTTSTTATYNATTLGAIATLPTRSYTISGFTKPAGNNADGATVSSTSTLTSTYTFNGWYKESGATNKIASNATTPALQASTSYTDANSKWTYTTAGAITLYAGWTSQAKTLPTITKTGYTCGWTTTSTGATTIQYASGGSFTPTANTTLYGVCTAKTYSLYINFAGSGVSSVQVRTASGTGGTLKGTVSSSGGYVSGLTYNTAYYLYPSFSSGYEFDKWAKTSGSGTLSSTSASNPTFTIGAGNGTVTITGKASVPGYCGKNGVARSNCMQTMTASDCTTTAKTVTDSRDGATYKVQKLADNKCWMLDNLSLGSTSTIALTPANTNITSNWTLPAGTTSAFDSFTTAQINVAYKNNTVTTRYGSGSGKIGVYYNYCAVSAGTYCMAEGSGSGNASHDICPKGWRMPTAGSSGEYQALYAAYSSNATNFRNALSTSLTGYMYRSSQTNVDRVGQFWSSTIYSNKGMFILYVADNAVSPTNNNYRRAGNTVRCLFGS